MSRNAPPMFLQDTIPALLSRFPAAVDAWPTAAFAGAMAVSVGGVVSGLTGWWKTILEIRRLRPQQPARSSPAVAGSAAGAAPSILIATTEEVRQYDRRIQQLEARSRRFALLACVGLASTLAVSVGGTAPPTRVATAPLPPSTAAPTPDAGLPAASPDEPVVAVLDTVATGPRTGEAAPPSPHVPTAATVGRGAASDVDPSIERRLSEASARLAGEGFAGLVLTRRGALREGEEVRVPLSLPLGSEYRVVAACGAGCDAMMLELRHPSGHLLSSADASGAVLMLSVASTEVSSYLLSARMERCASASCRLGIQVYRR